MKKSHITLLSILLITVVFIGGALLLKEKNTEQSKEESSPELEETENQAETITYENGDYVYIPSHDDIGYDSEAEIFYFDNIVNLFLVSEISDQQAEELAKTVDGMIVGRMQGAINVLQLQVEAESYEELSGLGDRFKDVDLVKYAELSTPLYMTDLNGTSTDPVDTGKNNWWADAINVYPAWDYIDKNPTKFKMIKVAVLESGKLSKFYQGNDADIKKSVSEDLSVWWSTYDNEHATLVTKIIAANDDPEKIRGVAAGVADIKFTGMGGNPIKEVKVKDADGKKVKDEDGKVMNELLIISILKSNLENGVKIFNNSWGFPIMSKELWKETAKDDSEETYKEYEDATENSNDKVSAQLIIAMDELLNDEDYDFLIVQSAGNGYLRAEGEDRSYDSGIEAKYTGSFANFNEGTYQIALDKLKVDKLGTELDEILDHIIVVGGAEQKTDGYASPGWAGYGDAVDIVAPAENLIIDSNEDYGSGTSFSAPMVSGTVALIWSYDLKLKAPEVKDLLLKGSNVKVWGRDGEKDLYPMLNVAGSLALVSSDFQESLKDSDANESEIKGDENICTKLVGNGSPGLTSGHYDELIETYITAISEKWDPFQLDELDLGPVQYSPTPLSREYGYELRDINNDGIAEMILGVNLEDGGTWIDEIYTLVDDTPVKVFASGIRHSAQIYCNGTINENAVISPGQGISVNLFYELDVDGIRKQELDEIDVRYEIDKNPFKKFRDGYEENATEETYKNLIENEKSMSEKEVKALRKKYENVKKIEPSFTPFVIDKK